MDVASYFIRLHAHLKGVHLCMCQVPADFTRLEATLDSYSLCSAEAAGVCVIVTDITLLIFLYNLVSTDGQIAD